MSYIPQAISFVGGALFGSLGIKLLTSKDAKKVYVPVVAAGLRAKDYVMTTVDTVQENANDILAAAQDLNEDRAAKEEAEAAAKEIADAEATSEGASDEKAAEA